MLKYPMEGWTLRTPCLHCAAAAVLIGRRPRAEREATVRGIAAPLDIAIDHWGIPSHLRR